MDAPFALTRIAGGLSHRPREENYRSSFSPSSQSLISRTSVALTGGAQTALYCFVVFYLICIAVTWWYYARKNAEVPC